MTNRTALVTGGGSGIGRAICEALAADDRDVAVADINTDGAAETVELITASGGTAIVVAIDVIVIVVIVIVVAVSVVIVVIILILASSLRHVNIHKFTKVLKQFADETQFIIVTHNKLTMEIANHMYGVTQEKKGVSKLVSVSFD